MSYGSTYQLYGADTCPHCNKIHEAVRQVRETSRSRFKLMQFMAEMMVKPAVDQSRLDVKKGLIATPHYSMGSLNMVGAGQKFMVGILISGTTILVAASGQNNGKIEPIAKMKKYIVCPQISAPDGHVSAVRRAIPKEQYANAQQTGAPSPGNCAAPRLIEHALKLGLGSAAATWEMSEVYYQPNTARRTADDSYWMHGLSAHHCETCKKLVPLLMCPETT